MSDPKDDTDPKGGAKRLSLATKILIGVVAGAAFGIFFGELVSPLRIAGQIYVELLQMTVLPYVVLSLATKIGRLSMSEVKPLAGRSIAVLVLLWAIALACVTVMSLSLPAWQAGSFFSASLVERPPPVDFIALFVPTNPFGSLAKNIVPASVLFSICSGVALIGIPNKARLLEPFETMVEVLARITDAIIRLSPIGTFAIMAGAAGTLRPQELVRLEGYIYTYTTAILLLTFVVLPLLVSSLTPFRYRDIVTGFRRAGLTAFATGKLFAVLTMLIEDVKRMLVQQDVPEQDAAQAADVFIPLAYPFPGTGKILGLLFIPFAAWFVGRPLELSDYPGLLSIGLLSFFGSPVAAVPFLLDLLKLPSDLFPLFIVAGVWCVRLGDILGAMHLTAFALLAESAGRGWLRVRAAGVTRWVIVVTVVGGGAVFANRQLIKGRLATYEPPHSLLARLDLTEDLVDIELVEGRPTDHDAAGGRLQQIRKRGVLRVGIGPDVPPFSFVNGDGRTVGFDVDLLQRLAADIGVDMQLVHYDWPRLQEQLETNEFDLAGEVPAGIENFGRLEPSHPYLELHVAVVVPDYRVAELRKVKSLRDESTLRLAFVRGGGLAQVLERRFPQLELVPLDSKEQFLESEDPGADMLLSTAETGAILTMLYPNFSVLVPEQVTARVPLVLAMSASVDREFSRMVDEWIALKKADGTIDRLYRHWILGEQAETPVPRWSLVRDVLGWID